MPPRRVLCVVGDPSGDRHLAWLVERLRERWPKTHFYGLGGPHLQAVGVEVLRESLSLSAVGFFNALRMVPSALMAREALRARKRQCPPDLAILVDFGAFNLRFGSELKREGVPIVYYFPPASWSTSPRHVGKVARMADLVLTPFPHSLPAYRAAGAEAYFVGHPLVEHLEPLRRRREAQRGEALAILPGSRRHEVALLLPLWLEAARQMQRWMPSLRWVVSRSPTIPEALFHRLWRSAEGRGEVVVGSEPAWEVARLAFVTSGTAALEGALLGIPMVVGYAATLANRLVYEWFYHPKPTLFAMPNILLGEQVLPEIAFVGISPQRPAEAALRLLEREDFLRHRLQRLRERLLPPEGTPPTLCAAQRLEEWWERRERGRSAGGPNTDG